jgi:hypothetical protein
VRGDQHRQSSSTGMLQRLSSRSALASGSMLVAVTNLMENSLQKGADTASAATSMVQVPYG